MNLLQRLWHRFRMEDEVSEWSPSDFEVEMECPDTQPTSPGALDTLPDSMPASLESDWQKLG